MGEGTGLPALDRTKDSSAQAAKDSLSTYYRQALLRYRDAGEDRPESPFPWS